MSGAFARPVMERPIARRADAAPLHYALCLSPESPMPSPQSQPEVAPSINVLGTPLVPCSFSPRTGFFRDGCCNTGPEDLGSHTICVQMTAEFLVFSRLAGNDLSTPAPQYGFAGLKPGDRWCLCAARWAEALRADVAPPVVLEATHEGALEHADLDDLLRHAFAQSV